MQTTFLRALLFSDKEIEWYIPLTIFRDPKKLSIGKWGELFTCCALKFLLF
jgi:hypothetical protein